MLNCVYCSGAAAAAEDETRSTLISRSEINITY